MFHALTHRNYRLFWMGAFLSNSGTWMQGVAQSWLVLQLTDSAFWLGADNFAMTLPGLLLTLVGGVAADLVDRKRLLIMSQVVSGLAAVSLAVLVAARVIDAHADVWLVIGLTFLTGCCWALAAPSYQALMVDLVGREDLANAIALNSTQFQLARVTGPLLAALTIHWFGLAGCFLANGLSYAAIVFALSRVKFNLDGETKRRASARPPHSLRDRRAMTRDLILGFRYVLRRPRVRVLVMCAGVVSMFGASYMVLIPVFARDVYRWGETGLSVMMGTAGAGALLGALTLAYLGDFPKKGRFVLTSAAAGGLCIAGFGLSGNLLLALPLLCGVGFAMVSFFATTNTLLQQLVTNRMRGRVMSIWLLSFVGGTTFGTILSGASAERFGPRATLVVCGIIIAVFAAWVGAHAPRLRDI